MTCCTTITIVPKSCQLRIQDITVHGKTEEGGEQWWLLEQKPTMLNDGVKMNRAGLISCVSPKVPGWGSLVTGSPAHGWRVYKTVVVSAEGCQGEHLRCK